MGVSRNGIYYDFNISPYRVTNEYGYEFVFSAELNVDRFKARQRDKRNEINSSLSNRFNIKINANEIADIVLYNEIEIRGYMIIKDGKKICDKSLIYVGETRTLRS